MLLAQSTQIVINFFKHGENYFKARDVKSAEAKANTKVQITEQMLKLAADNYVIHKLNKDFGFKNYRNWHDFKESVFVFKKFVIVSISMDILTLTLAWL